MKVSHRITRLATAGLVVGALAAPAASARPAPLDAPIPPGSDPVVIEPAPAPVVIDDGFDWGSAAIGAGAAGGFILLIGAGGTTYRHRRDHIGIAR
jgi:hypothetical protein